jgi:biotin synthase
MLCNNWTEEEISKIYNLPLMELVFQAASVHRENFNANEVQVSKLISIKTGGCSEDCGYCPQAARYNTGLKRKKLMETSEVLSLAQQAQKEGASRLCLGAAWREVKDGKQFEKVLEMITQVDKLGLEVCCTLGMVNKEQAQRLKKAGLHAYNHNIDSSRTHYTKVISTRTYDDRLNTIKNIRKANLTVCCGGILGLGEKIQDRIQMLQTLANMKPHPESVPINTLVAIKGTPLSEQKQVGDFDLVRIVATARIIMPKSWVRLSAGRLQRSQTTQALCFLAGANSIFAGDKLLTTANPDKKADQELFENLGLRSYFKKEITYDSRTKKTFETKHCSL